MVDLAGDLLAAVQHLASYHSNDDDNGGGWLALLAAGPAAGVAVWTTIFRYYRNTDKRNDYEHEAGIVAQPVTGSDQKVDEVHGTRRKRIDGDNVANYRQRVQRIPSDPEPR